MFTNSKKISPKVLCLIAGFLLLALFAGFSKWVKGGGLVDTDFAVTVKVQERIDRSSRLRLAQAVGNVMEGATFFASPGISTALIILLFLHAAAYPKNKKHRLRALVIPILFGLLVLGEIYGKSVVHHPAPPFFMIKNPTTIFPKYYINEQFSYPSGHAARAVFLGIIFYSLFSIHDSLLKRKHIRILGALGIISYVLLVAVSRIYLGHHWLSDVIGGGILGGAMGTLCLVGLL